MGWGNSEDNDSESTQLSPLERTDRGTLRGAFFVARMAVCLKTALLSAEKRGQDAILKIVELTTPQVSGIRPKPKQVC
jgi:hypothetical protein